MQLLQKKSQASALDCACEQQHSDNNSLVSKMLATWMSSMVPIVRAVSVEMASESGNPSELNEHICVTSFRFTLEKSSFLLLE